jgi:hypothetical protein
MQNVRNENTQGASSKEVSAVVYKTTHVYPILGNYESIISRKNGRIDVQATIQKLKELHVNTYYYLFGHGNSDMKWNTLRHDFLPAAQQAGINVVAYLTPPSEHTNPPYGGTT